jgi:hypothetical protein
MGKQPDVTLPFDVFFELVASAGPRAAGYLMAESSESAKEIGQRLDVAVKNAMAMHKVEHSEPAQ